MNEMNFKLFIESNEFEKDVKKMLKRLPANHSKLVKGYKFEKQDDNVLKNDPKNVGEIDEKNKIIKISSPWNYSRSFVALHEVAHAVWKYILNDEMKKSWNELVKKEKKTNKNKDGLKQNSEEIFCMIYAQFYCENKMEKYNYPNLEKFVKSI